MKFRDFRFAGAVMLTAVVTLGADAPSDSKLCVDRLAVVAKGQEGPFDPHVAATRQTPLDALPKPVQELVRKAIAATDKTGWEHAVMVLQVGDRFLVATGPSGDVITSQDDARVRTVDMLPLLLSLEKQATLLPPDARSQPATLFHVHTHPQKASKPGDMVGRPIRRDGEGNAYTFVSVPEDYVSQDKLRDALAVKLRSAGFTGSIGCASGPVPAGLSENGNPYLALHRDTTAVTATSPVTFHAFGFAPEVERITVRVGKADFARSTAGNLGTVTVPAEKNETVGTLYRTPRGWTYRPNALSETSAQVDGVPVPVTGVDLRPDGIVTVGGYSFHLR